MYNIPLKTMSSRVFFTKFWVGDLLSETILGSRRGRSQTGDSRRGHSQMGDSLRGQSPMRELGKIIR